MSTIVVTVVMGVVLQYVGGGGPNATDDRFFVQQYFLHVICLEKASGIR